jgi:hypothetical protein
MSRAIVCGGCGTSYRIPDTVKSRSAPCKKCGASIAIPVAAPARDAVAAGEPGPRKQSLSARAAARVRPVSHRHLRETPKKPALTPVRIVVALGALACLFAAWHFGHGGTVKPAPAKSTTAAHR